MIRLRHLAAASALAPRSSLVVAAPPLRPRRVGAVIVFDPTNYAQNVLTGGARAAADQQPDHVAAEPGADADQSGAQSREPAIFVAAAASISRSSARSSFSAQAQTHRLSTSSRSITRSRRPTAPLRRSASPSQTLIERAAALAELRRGPPGCAARAGRRGRQSRHQPHHRCRRW